MLCGAHLGRHSPSVVNLDKVRFQAAGTDHLARFRPRYPAGRVDVCGVWVSVGGDVVRCQAKVLGDRGWFHPCSLFEGAPRTMPAMLLWALSASFSGE